MTNRLAQESSPYLRQHAENPVHWQPWDEKALAQARSEDKPILLSIGYSACHWCHVMAHESFEDAATAEVMNGLFVNIKVDREERPDLDHIYQSAHQMLSGHAGGWPLTVFLTPDGTPFYSGTYFPPSPRHGLPGFVDLVERVAGGWATQREAIGKQNQQLQAALAETARVGNVDADTFDEQPVRNACDGMEAAFDMDNGGFGKAPKFPHPSDLALLLHRYRCGGNASAGAMLRLTLQRMAEGGIYDQLGGGFCRYSVDERWEIPHFEKMLYDNGPLLALYAEAAVCWDEPRFRQVAEETAAWALREMRAPEGAFWSALDADSEGEEGRFYVWTRDAVKAAVAPADRAFALAVFGMEGMPNFEGHAWHLTVRKPLDEIAGEVGMAPEQAEACLARVRAALLAARDQRVRPGLDDKILTAWNGLMIHALARAGRLLGRSDWIAAAQQAMDFIRTRLWDGERLHASWSGGQARLNGYLDDYAFVLAALVELMQAEWRSEDAAFAGALADTLIARFGDENSGGFYFTSADHEVLLHRPRSGHDGATPSGNGVAARALQQLGHVLGEPRYLAASTGCLRAFYGGMRQSAMGYGSLHVALAEWLTPPRVVVLRGPQRECEAWARQAAGLADPATLLVSVGERGDLPPVLAKPIETHVNAWVCSGVECLSPIDDWVRLARELGG